MPLARADRLRCIRSTHIDDRQTKMMLARTTSMTTTRVTLYWAMRRGRSHSSCSWLDASTVMMMPKMIMTIDATSSLITSSPTSIFAVIVLTTSAQLPTRDTTLCRVRPSDTKSPTLPSRKIRKPTAHTTCATNLSCRSCSPPACSSAFSSSMCPPSSRCSRCCSRIDMSTTSPEAASSLDLTTPTGYSSQAALFSSWLWYSCLNSSNSLRRFRRSWRWRALTLRRWLILRIVRPRDWNVEPMRITMTPMT
mmetsp:Transcript_20726/g.51943  ORF Transcript_20726/g.51943 Transcript_20726/m.51943 type:complete len:251 (+) Transcript_20726:594-1346(+)